MERKLAWICPNNSNLIQVILVNLTSEIVFTASSPATIFRLLSGDPVLFSWHMCLNVTEVLRQNSEPLTWFSFCGSSGSHREANLMGLWGFYMCRLKKNLQPCQCTKFQHNMAHAKVLCMVQMELCIDSLRQGDLLVVHILVNVESKEDDYYPGTTLDMTFNETGLLAKKLQLWLTVSLCVMVIL